jgi:type I restriction enzyme M protein
VRSELFPYLHAFKTSEASPDTLQYKIGEIFSGIQCKLTSGYVMRDVFDEVDNLRFQSSEDQHEMSSLYEIRISRMGNAGRNGGEYYTPRPLIRSIIAVLEPKIGERIYDGACGSAGFLCEAYSYMKNQVQSVADNNTLQNSTFFGKEKKGLPYIIATMNMIFHGVAAPNIIRGNTLAENLSAVSEKDRKHVILANPPFGGSEREEVKQNFDVQTSETAYMFMQHFIKMLKAGGRAGIVIKNTFLSNGDAAAVRKKLLEECNVHTILELPKGAFTGAGVKTVVVFFTKGEPTKKIWYYQLNLDRTLGKTNPLNANDLAEFVELYKTKGESENSWTIDATTLGEDCDLSVKNPNKVDVINERTTEDILNAIADLNANSASLIAEIRELL